MCPPRVTPQMNKAGKGEPFFHMNLVAVPVRAIWCTTLLAIASELKLPAQTASGTGSTCGSPLSSEFYSKFTVVESAIYQQTNAAGATLLPTHPYGFGASINLRTNLSATAAELTVPGQAPRPMAKSDPRHFIFGVTTNTLAELTALFPPGTYSLAASNQTAQAVSFPAAVPPNPPQVINYDAAQAIDPAKDFTLGWSPFTGATTAMDFIALTIDDQTGTTVLKAADPGCPGYLEGPATSLLIPANTLETNQTYKVNLTFVHILTIDTNSIPNVALLSGMESQTQFKIATGMGSGGTQPSPLVLTNAAWLPSGAIRFDLTTVPGTAYTIQFNPDLSQASGWRALLSTNAISALLSITNIPPAASNAGFYRVFHN